MYLNQQYNLTGVINMAIKTKEVTITTKELLKALPSHYEDTDVNLVHLADALNTLGVSGESFTNNAFYYQQDVIKQLLLPHMLDGYVALTYTGTTTGLAVTMVHNPEMQPALYKTSLNYAVRIPLARMSEGQFRSLRDYIDEGDTEHKNTLDFITKTESRLGLIESNTKWGNLTQASVDINVFV